MTAPGKHLEFGESGHFSKKVCTVEGLGPWIRKQLEDWPLAGVHICGSVREVKMAFEQRACAVVYLRRGQQIRLLEIFGLPEDEEDLEQYRQRVKTLFCGGGQ